MGRHVTIGAPCPVSGGFYFGRILTGVNRVVAAAGGRLVFIQTLRSGLYGDNEISLLPIPFTAPVGWAKIDGFISVAEAVQRSYLEGVRAAGKPVVLVSKALDGFDCPSVRPDNAAGIGNAVAHLVAHGHRRIAFAGNLAQHDMVERYHAYQAALREHGLATDPDLYIEATDNMVTGGLDAGRALLDAGIPATALVAATDANAIGIVQTLAEHGRSVPDDLAIIGFDDSDEGSQTDPPLSTVSANFDRLGELAANLLLRQLRGDQVAPEVYSEAASLIVRESCGCGMTRIRHGATPPAGAPAVGGQRLTSRLHALLLPERPHSRSARQRVAAATEAVVRLFDAALQGGRPAVPIVMATARSLYPLAARRESLVRPTAGRRAALDATVLDLTLALTGLESTEYRGNLVDVEQRMLAHHDVGMALLRPDQGDPASLRWLRRTDARFGCLGPWVGESRTGDQIEIAGIYGDNAELAALLGTRLPIKHFPPDALTERANSAAGEIIHVVSVCVDALDWGFIAVPAGIDTHSAGGGREVTNHRAALLAVALLHKRQREELTQAYNRVRELAEHLRVSEERYALAVRAASDGLWDWRLDRDAVFYSDRWAAILGYQPDELDATPHEWLSRVHPDDREALEQAISECRRGTTTVLRHEHRLRVHDGSYRWMLCRALAVHAGDGTASRLVGSLTDIDDRRKLEEHLRYVALYDPLTGLANRKLFLDRLEAAIGASTGAPGEAFAVLFCDLDGFKAINDEFGHPVGDQLLACVAARLDTAVRSTDLAARLGGDEFAILLTGLGPTELTEVVHRIQAAVTKPVSINGREIAVGVSIGVASSDAGYTCSTEVLRDADLAMYQAKSRNRRRRNHPLRAIAG